MTTLRLYHRLLIAMGAILLLQAVVFYSLVKYRMEARTIGQITDRLLQSNLLFKNFRTAQARLLTTVGRSVAEHQGLKATADMLNNVEADKTSEADAYKMLFEQANSISRTVVSDMLLVLNKRHKLLVRIMGTEKSWTHERAYAQSELLGAPRAETRTGPVQVVLSYPADRSRPESPTVTAVVSLDAGSLIAIDNHGLTLPPELQRPGDGSVPSDIPFAPGSKSTPGGTDGTSRLPVEFWVYRGELYQVAYAPLKYADNDVTVGSVIVGYRIGRDWAVEIKKASESEMVFFVRGKVVASSFPLGRERELESLFGGAVAHSATQSEEESLALRPGEPLGFDLGGEEYRAVERLLPGTDCHYLVALSWTQALRPLLALEGELKLVAVAVFFMALLMAVGVARSITRPLGDLSGAMSKVMKGDFSSRLRVLTPLEVAQLAEAFNSMVQGLSEREQYKKMVSRSASELVRKLATTGGESSDVSSKVEATVLFSDIRSFTTLCEGMSPEAVVGMLNEYFEAMGRVIAANDGDIDKFIGDAIMAFFKSTPERDSAESAVLCAIQMQNEMHALNERRRRETKPEIRIGVGLNTGVVVEGHVGTKNRFEHTMLGDTVNVASRLEGECKRGSYLRIVISQSTYDRVKKLVEVVPMGSTKLKGKTEELPIYEVKSLADAESVIGNLEAPEPETRIRAIERLARLGTPEQLDRLFAPLSDRDASVRCFTARILGQSPHVAGAARHLIAALDAEADEEIRLEMIAALGALGGFEALEYLRKLCSDSSAAVRREVVVALESLGGRAAADLLASAAADADPAVRAAAGLALFRVGQAEGMTVLEAMATGSDLPLELAAIRALGDLGITLQERRHLAEQRNPSGQESFHFAQLLERVAGLLLRALESPAAEARVGAIESLARMRHRLAVRALSDRAADPDPAVSRAARDALGTFES